MARMTAAEKQAKFAELRQRFSAGTITDAQLRDEIQKMSDDVTPSEMLFDEFGNPNIANWPTLEVPGDGVKTPPNIFTQPEVKPADSMDSLIEFVKFGAPAAAPPGTQGTGMPGISGVDAPLGAVPNPLAFGVTPDLGTLGVRDPFGAYTATRSRGVPVYDPTMGSMAGYQSALGMGYQPERGRFFLSPATQGTGSWAEYLSNPMRQQPGVQNYGQSFGQMSQMIADPLGFEASNPLSGRFAQFFDPNNPYLKSEQIAGNLADAALASMGGPRSFNPALRDMFTRRFGAMSMSDPTVNRQQSLANYANWLNSGLGGATLAPRSNASNLYSGTPYVDPNVSPSTQPYSPPPPPLYEDATINTQVNPISNQANNPVFSPAGPNLTFVNQPATPVPTPVPTPVQPSQPAGVPLTPEVFSGLPSDEQFGVMTGIGGWLGQFDKATQDALRGTGKLDFMNMGAM